MAILTNKLYRVQPNTSAENESPRLVEIKGNVNLTIYGTEEKEEDITAVADMTPASEAISADFYQALSNVPEYIAFIGTADRINLRGYDYKYIKDIS